MRYLTPEPPVRFTSDYQIEDGVLIDATERRWSDRAYNELTRYHRPSKAEQMTEEAAWAAKSGPVTTTKETVA